LTSDKVNDKIQFASVDVSFISLTKILVPARELLEDKATMVCLIKPQFEAGREKVGKKGVVRDKKVHIEVIRQVMEFAYNNQFDIKDISYSPIKGPEGNIEYLIYIQKNSEKQESTYNWEEIETIDELKDICKKILDITNEAHSNLE
jgi:23S rRNA (cytidine1920-2'-O)/16S rRNA (cytidine1409-2'-O)-methyltransferase